MKHQVLDFQAKKYVPTKFNMEKHFLMLVPGAFIKFHYGVGEDPQYWTPMIGKVSENPREYKSGWGIGVYTSDGWHCVEPIKISKIYLEKTAGKIRENRLKATVNDSVGLLDAAIDRLIAKVNTFLKEVKTIDNRHDTQMQFFRKTNFKGPTGEVEVYISGPDVDVMIMEPINPSGRKSSFGINHNRWINVPLAYERIALLCAGKKV